MSTDSQDTSADWSPEGKIGLYRQMIRIRMFEQTALRYYTAGRMGGWLFMSIGQEMVAAVVRSLMRPGDHSISGPRGMGHAVAAGMEMNTCMAELFGRVTGCSKGKGGALSFFDPARGFWGCHGIAAAHVPLASGLAYALKYRGEPGVVFCFLGDGSVNQGVFHESMNLSALQGLPVIYVIENNGYCFGSSVRKLSRFKGCLARRAEGYDMDWDCFADGDPYEMRQRIQSAIHRARTENRPTLLEIDTYRYHGFSVADSRHKGGYRTLEEIEARKARDPLLLWRQHLIEEGLLDEAQAEAIKQAQREEADEAVVFADGSAPPGIGGITGDVYWETDHDTDASRIGRHFFTE
ncbi:MAG: thiamine pyrophosphate-dependent dehydrogenase E1 component subunit alpha [Verrucomicrobiaceae bacterium]|nr:MAG: thiamine pyrophosphate-dependent dehydrogenase E1 component subunit alpha [Verrucomicrobiaceae bacterium]